MGPQGLDLRIRIWGNYHSDGIPNGNDRRTAFYQATLAKALAERGRRIQEAHHLYQENMVFELGPETMDYGEAKRLRAILGEDFLDVPCKENFFEEERRDAESGLPLGALRLQALDRPAGAARAYALLRNLGEREASAGAGRGVYLHATSRPEIVAYFNRRYEAVRSRGDKEAEARIDAERERYLGLSLALGLERGSLGSELDIVIGALHLQTLPERILESLQSSRHPALHGLEISQACFRLPEGEGADQAFNRACARPSP